MNATFDKAEIFMDYEAVMRNEIRMRRSYTDKKHSHLFDDCGDVLKCVEEIYHAVWRIFEVAQSSFVSRAYNFSYNLFDNEFVYESVGAHTNIVIAIVTEALDFYYGKAFGNSGKRSPSRTVDGYSYREIIEAVRLHDLPENVMGDLADNGNRDEDEKYFQESRYLKTFFDTYPEYNNVLKHNASKILGGMRILDSLTGRLVYLSDKVAALMVTLCLDALGKPPMILENSPYASKKDQREMEFCDFSCEHAYKASEMWTVDFFMIRELVKYDENSFFTALIVMATLMVNGRWYSWREKVY